MSIKISICPGVVYRQKFLSLSYIFLHIFSLCRGNLLKKRLSLTELLYGVCLCKIKTITRKQVINLGLLCLNFFTMQFIGTASDFLHQQFWQNKTCAYRIRINLSASQNNHIKTLRFQLRSKLFLISAIFFVTSLSVKGPKLTIPKFTS